MGPTTASSAFAVRASAGTANSRTDARPAAGTAVAVVEVRVLTSV
ncbi:hypothetical protein [Isoptericola sp. NPDC056573]